MIKEAPILSKIAKNLRGAQLHSHYGYGSNSIVKFAVSNFVAPVLQWYYWLGLFCHVSHAGITSTHK